MSISEKLTRLQNAKTDIADAITENGGTVEDTDGLEEYPERITSRFGEVNNVLSILLKGPTLISKTITENGEYLAEDDNADGYSSVLVNVESYTIADAGKVVNSTGTGLVSQTAYGTVTTNGTIDTTLNNSVTVNVPTYSSSDNGKVIKNGALSSQTNYGTVTTNGTYTTTYNNSINVNVPTIIPLTAITSGITNNDMKAYLSTFKSNPVVYIFGSFTSSSDYETVEFSYPNNIDLPNGDSSQQSRMYSDYYAYTSIRFWATVDNSAKTITINKYDTNLRGNIKLSAYVRET